ncbi:MAG: helix-turn-helix transcriptional regulator [Clostridia bacterium]|nr:helix-turn-helix transcriptional regulator [Clostridia bacterium]
MKLDVVGKNIRKYRLLKSVSQEKLAERADLTPNYIGMIERGEKTPSLQSFIKIVNALEVSADVILCDVLKDGYTVKDSLLHEKLSKISDEDRIKIYDVIDTMISHSKRKFL